MSALEHQIPAGFKNTDVGIVPFEWDVKTGKELFIKIQDGTHFSPKITGGDYLYLTSKNIKYGYMDLNNVEYIDQVQHEKIFKRCDVRKNDILLTKDGANTGNAALNRLSEPFSLLSSVALLRLNEEYNCPEFFLQQILTSGFQDKIQGDMSGNAITRLTLEKINNLKFIVPKKPEQTAIANALSDVDALLTELEKLIAKKQAIKTATMQQLLTGKTRLPQFAFYSNESTEVATDTEGAVKGKNQGVPKGKSKGTKPSELGDIPEDWDVVCLGDIAEVRMCKRVLASQTKKAGDIPFYKIGTFGGKPDSFISKDLYEDFKRKYSFPETGDILISAAGTLGKTVIFDGHPSYFQDSNIVWLDIDKARICNEFLFHYYCVIKWASTEGSTISRLYNGIIKASLVTIPPKEEQTAIATILSDMDNEIQTLEQRLAKTRQIKQGMMQELLTGRTRLPFDQE